VSIKTRPGGAVRGRGTANTITPRYLETGREAIDDGWDAGRDRPDPVRTTVTVESPPSIVSRNESPDVPFEQSINPYRGCEHGCVYCYARPTHAYLDLSPGIDFESRLFAKPGAADLLNAEIGKPGYRCSPIALGTNTDPYQPIEREWRITRQIIETLQRHDHPLTIVTKSALVERDIDLLAPMAEKDLVQVYLSVTTLDEGLQRRLEPRAAAPYRRLAALARLKAAGIPVGVMFAPMIPVLNDSEMETVLERAAAAGATAVGYVMLRLPHEVKQLFREWLQLHYPLKAGHIMNRVLDIRGGRDNDPAFGARMRGRGIYAELIAQRFHRACRRLGLNRKRHTLDTSRFVPPARHPAQMQLFPGSDQHK